MSDVKGIGLLRSSDLGHTWEVLNLPFPYQPTFVFAVGRRSLLVVGDRETDVHVSFDGGLNWKKMTTGLPNKGVNTLRVDLAGEIYAASSDGQGFYRLTDGSGWEKIIAADEYGGEYTCWDVVFLPDYKAVTYGYNDILLSSKDLRTWQRRRFGQPFDKLWLDAAGRIWTQRTISTFFLAGNGEWQESTDLPKDRYTQFAQLDKGLFAAIRMEGGVDVLLWTGGALELIRRGLEGSQILALAADREHAMLAGSEAGLWVSGDFGESWQELELQP
jgi:hypothetical protein